ncbi:MAG: nitroreductase/quinone reductase family protein [Solirubrobacterales bacterium]
MAPRTIPAVDPNAERGPVRRAFYSFGQSKAGRWYGIKIGSRIDPPMLRLTRGRFATTSLLPLVLLHVRGARSGEIRTIPLVYFTEGDDVLLIASSFGRAKNPAWYYNLLANPDVELTAGGVTAPYRSEEVADEAERQRLFKLGVANFEGYGNYERMAGERKIPVLRLSPSA